MYIYIYIYCMYIHIYMHGYVFILAFMRAKDFILFLSVCRHTCIPTYMHTYIQVRESPKPPDHLRERAKDFILYQRISVCIHICIPTYTHTYIQVRESPKPPDHLPESAKDFISQCFILNPMKRPPAHREYACMHLCMHVCMYFIL